MKFLLIDVGYDCEELNEPLAIEALYSYLKIVPTVEPYLFCENHDTCSYPELFNKINPDIVGVSTHINTWERLERVYEFYSTYCKTQNRNKILIVGGILGTYEFERILTSFKNTICAIGEGEETLRKLIEAYRPSDDYASYVERIKDIHNVAFWVNQDILLTNRQGTQHRENLYPICDHYYLKNTLSQGGIARIEGSRGCPWNNCSFCVLKWKYAGNGWIPRPLKNIVKELIEMSKAGATTVFFTDEEFLGGSKERIITLLNQIHDLKADGSIINSMEFVISTSTRALTGKYGIPKEEIRPILLKMKSVGFRSFFLGIESGSDTQLQRFQKGCTAKEHESVIAMLNDCQIEVDIGYIIFDPLMTLDELYESVSFLRNNNLHHNISRFAKRLRIVPHTDFRNLPNLNITSFDSREVEYLYTFNDKYVQEIYDKYSNLEREHLHYSHLLQAEIRFASSSDFRNDRIKELQNIRLQEFLLLEKLVNNAMKERER